MALQAFNGAVLLVAALGVALAVLGAIAASPSYDDVRGGQ